MQQMSFFLSRDWKLFLMESVRSCLLTSTVIIYLMFFYRM